MADSFVQVAPDGGGKNIDTETVTEADGTVSHRQVIVVGDSTDNGGIARVNAGALNVSDVSTADGGSQTELLSQILLELRIQTWILASEFRVRDDIGAMRSYPTMLI